MAKIRRDEIIDAGLALLDEIGLDALTTRKLALRLGVESPTLYWHFSTKSALMSAMALEMVVRHHVLPVADSVDRWAEWLGDNARSFRAALLACRDGARLHVGSTPESDAEANILLKIAYLQRAGFAETDARLALLTTGQFALASALEQQAHEAGPAGSGALAYDAETAFGFGLDAMIDGLRLRLDR